LLSCYFQMFVVEISLESHIYICLINDACLMHT
jgi:hypothetical protein